MKNYFVRNFSFLYKICICNVVEIFNEVSNLILISDFLLCLIYVFCSVCNVFYELLKEYFCIYLCKLSKLFVGKGYDYGYFFRVVCCRVYDIL